MCIRDRYKDQEGSCKEGSTSGERAPLQSGEDIVPTGKRKTTMSTNQPTTASRLYTQVKKLEDDINTELTNQDNVKANMDRLDKEKQAQQAIANNKENTSADIAEAKKELERIAKERKAEDKKYRDLAGILAALYTDKNQAEADLKVALNTPVVNPDHDFLVAEVNDLKATMAAMTQDLSLIHI